MLLDARPSIHSYLRSCEEVFVVELDDALVVGNDIFDPDVVRYVLKTVSFIIISCLESRPCFILDCLQISLHASQVPSTFGI